MNDTALTDLTITELNPLIRHRKVSSLELVKACLDRIDGYNSKVNAIVALDRQKAFKAAEEADYALERGNRLGPLHGIPLAVKDNYWTAEYPTTACSRVNDEPNYGHDATAVARLRAAGAIIIGKTNMHEWAHGATNEFSAFGPTKNPWNREHITGGSSGGSGAALAARLVPGALGSDTGGSVRIPSSGCGVCGLKPTYGRVSRYGILPLSWSLDVSGPMARSAQDLAVLLSVMAGPDPKDKTSQRTPLPSFRPSTPQTVKGLRLAIPVGKGFEKSDDVADALYMALEILQNDGAEVVEIEIPKAGLGFAAWDAILLAEASAYHQQFMADRIEDYSSSVRVPLEAGRYISAVEYIAAQQARTVFNREMEAIFEEIDCFVTPTLPVTAPRIGQGKFPFAGGEITSQNAMTYFTWIANLTGLPAVSIPCGFGNRGLPVGMMIMGPGNGEMEILGVADRFQMLTDWHKQSPNIGD